MNKTIQKKQTIPALLLLSFCFIRPEVPIHDDSSNYNIEKHIKHVNAGGFGVKGGYTPPYDLRFMEDASFFWEESFI